MKNYEKPNVVITEEMAEGIFLASGTEEKTCTKGKKQWGPHSDSTCQNCMWWHQTNRCPEGIPKKQGC